MAEIPGFGILRLQTLVATPAFGVKGFASKVAWKCNGKVSDL